MTTPAGYVVTYISGNKTAIIGEKKPEQHEFFRTVEPFFMGHVPVMPMDRSMVPHLKRAYIAGFSHGKTDRTFMPTKAKSEALALIGFGVFLATDGKHLDEQKPPTVDYAAAAEHLSFAINGVKLTELSDKEQTDIHRWVRSTINAALGNK